MEWIAFSLTRIPKLNFLMFFIKQQRQAELKKISNGNRAFFPWGKRERNDGNVGGWTWENAMRSTKVLKIGIDYWVLTFKRFLRIRIHLSPLHCSEVEHVLP